MRRALPIVLLATACTTTSAVTTRGVSGLESPTSGEAIYITDEHGAKLRVDPNTLIRFKRTDGAKTPWVRARKLHANGAGVFRIHRLDLDDVESAEIHGLHPDGVQLLARAKPHDAELYEDGELLHLAGPRGSIVAWVTAYVAHRADRADASDGAWWARDEGRWRFRYPFGGWSTPVDGHALTDAIEDGLDVPVGLAFDDMTGAEVRNFSGSKSLALVVGSAAVIAAIVAAAKSGGGGGGSSGGGGVSAGGRMALATAEVAVHMIDAAARCGRRCAERRRTLPKDALISPMMASPDAIAAQPLFTARARRKSDVEVVVASALGYDITGAGATSPATLSAALRLRDFVELGGGVRYVGGRDDGQYLAFARGGGLFHLDDEHWIGVALLFDIGGGSRAMEMKLNMGLRFEWASGFGFGLYPFNPTWLRVGSGDQAVSGWSFPSTAEISFAF